MNNVIIQNSNGIVEEVDHKGKGIEIVGDYPKAKEILFEGTKGNIIELLRGEDGNFKASILKNNN